MENTIFVESIERMCRIVALLERENLRFHVAEESRGWSIRITGH